MAYIGESRDRLRHGQGAYTFPGGYFHYSGDWQRGLMHGKGEFTMGDGSTYSGDFVDGEIDGIGLRRWPDGATYNGHFKHGERHGEGVYISSEGEIYEGHWENNQRCGKGELKYRNGDVYIGTFLHHWPHGAGQIVYARDASRYDGEWSSGEISGRGSLRDNHGHRLYDGEWLAGQRHGEGVGYISMPVQQEPTLTSLTPIVYEGVWRNNTPAVWTTHLGFRMIVNGNTDNTSAFDTHGTDLADAPAILTIAKAANGGCIIPSLVVVSLCEVSDNNSTSIVIGESGRRLRLRVFEGEPPSTPPSDTANDVPPEGGTRDGAKPPAQWQFVPAAGIKNRKGVEDESFAVEATIHSSESINHASSMDVNATADDESSSVSRAPTPAPRMSDVTMDNIAGRVMFNGLALPETSLVGSYFLVCDDLVDETVSPAYLALTIVE